MLQKVYLLLIAKFALYLLQKLLVGKYHLVIIAKFACYILVTEVAHCKELNVTCYKGNSGINVCLKTIKIG